MRILVTGGTVFVSRYTAAYFVQRGHEVYVLNRGTRPQVPGVTLIQRDRHNLGNTLHGLHFDAVLDICAYNGQDIDVLLDALDSFDDYILISSSAVYPETLPQPFYESQPVGLNTIWGSYGTGKIAAEQNLLQRVSGAYILRPPYLYGPMQNVYREPFVFECAEAQRPFYIPGNGTMHLQFFHVQDLCRLMELILAQHPIQHILNVGNQEVVDICTFVALCYQVVGANLECRHVTEYPQRAYFPFHAYDYVLDVNSMAQLLPAQQSLLDGLAESYYWFQDHRDEVRRKPLLEFIDSHFPR